ncbi:MAG TPA: hypothetical protein DDW52_19510 [Planctomycetaceae bacterium]|nr:hypothetical protein [Planctomycetaceae bacterium]
MSARNLVRTGVVVCAMVVAGSTAVSWNSAALAGLLLVDAQIGQATANSEEPEASPEVKVDEKAEEQADEKADEKVDAKGNEKFDQKLAAELGADPLGMRKFVFCTLVTGPTKITDPQKRKAIFDGHFSNMGRLAGEGKLVLAGPFVDGQPKRGMYIFNVSTLEEAEIIVKTDPAVEAGVFDYELTKLYASAALMKINEIHSKIQRQPLP